jgi:nucleotide-binding universal stress UspA family protein
VLAATIARATAADVILVAVHPDPEIPTPREMNGKALHEQAAHELRKVRDDIVPDAITVVETNWSVPQALERVVSESRRDLLVVGSSRRGEQGRVRIGDTTRRLLGDAQCALAVAPRGFSEPPGPSSRSSASAMTALGSPACSSRRPAHVGTLFDPARLGDQLDRCKGPRTPPAR